jgi:hypothetical protein
MSIRDPIGLRQARQKEQQGRKQYKSPIIPLSAYSHRYSPHPVDCAGILADGSTLSEKEAAFLKMASGNTDEFVRNS